MPNALPLKSQNEIMSIVITKLINIVSIQSNELILLRDENKDLKNKLTSLYKTIIQLKSIRSPININHFPSTKLILNSALGPFLSPQITKNKPKIRKPYLLTINKCSVSKGKISRNNNSSHSRKTTSNNNSNNHNNYSNLVNVSNNDTQSMLMTTHDKINSSKYLSNTSSNGYITLSPKPIGDYYQYQKGKKGAVTQTSIDDNLSSTSKSKDKRAKIIKRYKEIQKIDEKNLIKVSIVKKKR